MKKWLLRIPHGGEVEVEGDRICAFEAVLSGEYNPHRVRLWVTLTMYGPAGATWAVDVGDALDELVDHDLANAILLDEDAAREREEEGNEPAYLGNAGEPADLTDVDVQPVLLDIERDWELLSTIALCQEKGEDFLTCELGSPRNVREMYDLLLARGYSPWKAAILDDEGMGEIELRERLKMRPGEVGSLEYTHDIRKLHR
jgi:hypothetical protein